MIETVANPAAWDLPGSFRRTAVRVSRAAVARVLLATALTFAGVSAVGTDGDAAEAALNQVAAAARPSMVLVHACRPGGGLCRYSTAWSAAPHLFITSAHGLLGQAAVTLDSRRLGVRVTAAVIAVDAAHDLALVRGDLDLSSLTRAGDASDGERLVAVCSRRALAYQGHPNQLGLYEGELGGAIRVTQSRGQLLLERVDGAASVLGCSGGPVLDERGDVVGITVAGDGHSAGMVPVAVALRLLDTQPVASR
jgi:hypothetical protein